MRCNFRKTTMTILLVLCMAVSMFAVDAFAKDNDSTTTNANSTSKIDTCERKVVEYTAARAKRYIAGDNTYPEVEGYLFAGWYNSEACNDEADAIKDGSPSGEKAYALFLPEHVLSIRAQASATLIDDDVNNDEKGSMRFVTSVDSLLYKTVGFEISYKRANGSIREVTSESKNVYSKLYVAGTTTEWKKLPSDVFCNLSKYFKICTLKNFSMADYMDTDFQVKPYWVTLSGDKVYGVEATKSFEKGCLREEVWVTSLEGAADAPTRGGYNNPYKTLDYAISHVVDGGTVRVKDHLNVDGSASDGSIAQWTSHNKKVTITGCEQDDILDFTATSKVLIKDSVTFTNITLGLMKTGTQHIFAEGNEVVVANDVIFSNVSEVKNKTATLNMNGGSRSNDVENTNIKLYAGTYSAIYGGSGSTNVKGDTNVTVGNGVNSGIDYRGHDKDFILFGGSYSGTVSGNANISIEAGANFNYIYGGGDAEASSVLGETNITFAGNAMSIYGGSRAGKNRDTHVTVLDGNVDQIFGGCEKNSMTGDTDVRVLGGNILRRIYGGCYNEWPWGENLYQVHGRTNVTIGSNVALDSYPLDDNQLCSLSRYKQTFENETGTLIFCDDLYDSHENKINNFEGDSEYHYLVKATTGGEVTSAGDMICIKPDSGKVATVTIGNEVKHYTEGESYYLLPSLTSSTSKETIVVTFGTEKITDFSSYEAKIGSAYYRTLEEAIAVAEKTNATITNLSDVKGLTTISIKNSKNGTVKSEAKNYIAGATAKITVTPDEGYYLSDLNVKKDGTEVTLSEEVNISGGTYTFTTEAGNYTVEAIFAKKVFETPTSGTYTLWDVSNQNQEMITLPDGGEKIKGIISATTFAGAGTNNDALYFNDEYTDMDLTLTVKNDNTTTAGSVPETTIVFDFGLGLDYILRLSVWENTNENAIIIRAKEGMLSYTRLCKLSDEQRANYKSSTGVELRVVKQGTKIFLYVDGEECVIGTAHGSNYYAEDNIDLGTISGNKITADTKAKVSVRRYGDEGLKINMPFSVAHEVNLIDVDIATTEHGTVTTENTHYFVGDKVTFTAAPEEGYFLRDLTVKESGVEVALDKEISISGGAYSFVTEAGDCTIEATFSKKVFVTPTDSTNTLWDVSNQNQEIVTLPNGGTKISGTISAVSKEDNTNFNTLKFYDSYKDMDLRLTIKDAPNTNSSTIPDTRIWYQFGDNELQLSVTELGGDVVIRDLNSSMIGKRLYKFTEAQENKYKSDEGVELRIVRVGTQVYLYIDGTECAIGRAANGGATSYYEGTEINLATLSNNAITADTEATVLVRRWGDAGTEVEMPFSVANEVNLVNVDSATTEHGTVSTDNTHYFGGDMVTLSVTPDEGYYLSNLSVKKNDTNISLDQEIDMNGGTYSFVADGGEYTVEATFAEKVFTDPTSNYTEWNLMQQNQGSVTLTNGRTGIKGVISATTKAGAGTDNDALYFNDEYTDMDLTLTVKNDNTTTAGSTPETIFVFDFGSGKVLRISITEIGGEAIIRTTDGILSWKRLYRLSDEQKANYKSSKGVELRIVRKGTQIYLGVDGVACAIGAAAHDNDTRYYAENNINLATLSGNVIKEDTPATVSIRRYGDEGKQIDMPFTITNEVKETISGKCHVACWDLTKQYIDVVTYKKTSHSSWGAYVYIGEELSHGDIDFSMKVKEERKDTAISSEAIQFKYKVDNTEKVVKFILQTDQNGAYITVRTNGDTTTNTRNANVSVYRLSTEEYAQYQNTGINWRIVRRGLSFSVYINGVQCDLDENVNSSYSGLIQDNKIVLTETTYYTASALVTLVLEYIDASGTIENVSIPYKLYTTVDEDLLVTTSLNTELFYMNKKKQAQLLTHMC